MKQFGIIILILSMVTMAYGLRIPRPVPFNHPMSEDEVLELNKEREEIWNTLNGRISIDDVSTSKSKADKGDIWFITTGATTRIQYKGNNNVIYTITPDGH